MQHNSSCVYVRLSARQVHAQIPDIVQLSRGRPRTAPEDSVGRADAGKSQLQHCSGQPQTLAEHKIGYP